MASKEFSKPQFVTMTEEELDNVAPIKYSDEFMAGFRESIKAHGGMKIPPNSIFLKPSRAYYVIQDLVENIFAAYTRLNDILSRQEAVIRKRWTKKTTKQREKILLECWPNMPARHRSDLQELCDHNYVATKIRRPIPASNGRTLASRTWCQSIVSCFSSILVVETCLMSSRMPIYDLAKPGDTATESDGR